MKDEKGPWGDWPFGPEEPIVPMKQPDFTAQERAGMVAWRLAKGHKMSMKDIQNLTELSERGAQKLIIKLARVLPIRRSEGVWASS